MTSVMTLKRHRRELEEIGRAKDRRVWESDDDYVARMAANKARELVLRQEIKALQGAH
jgi:hypothetical protein